MDNSKYNSIDCLCPHKLGHTGDIIRTARKYRGLSQSSLATLCGLSPKMISLVECGNRNISWEAFQRVLKGLRFSVTFYPAEMQPMPEELVLILNDVIPNLRDLLKLLEKIEEASEKRPKRVQNASSIFCQ